LEWQKLGVNVRSSEPPRRVVRNGVKNLHGSKTIPKSLYKAFWYHGNKDAYMGCPLVEGGGKIVYNDSPRENFYIG
jgi:hypothetical protein